MRRGLSDYGRAMAEAHSSLQPWHRHHLRCCIFKELGAGTYGVVFSDEDAFGEVLEIVERTRGYYPGTIQAG